MFHLWVNEWGVSVCWLTAEVILLVSLQWNLRLVVRELLITSYTMTPLAHTPSSSSPNTGFFSRPARWNSTPYSGSSWTLCGQIIMHHHIHKSCSDLLESVKYLTCRCWEDEKHFVTCSILHPSHSLKPQNATPKTIGTHIKMSEIHKFKYLTLSFLLWFSSDDENVS